MRSAITSREKAPVLEHEASKRFIEAVKEALIKVLGEEDTREDIKCIEELGDDPEAVVNYAYGVLITAGHDPVELIDASGLLESSDEKV